MRTNNERYECVVTLNDFKRCWTDGLFTEYKTLLVTAYSQIKVLIKCIFGRKLYSSALITIQNMYIFFLIIKYLWQTVQALSSVMNPDGRRKENEL